MDGSPAASFEPWSASVSPCLENGLKMCRCDSELSNEQLSGDRTSCYSPIATAYATLPPPTIGLAVATQRFLKVTAGCIEWKIRDVGRKSAGRARGQFSRLVRNLTAVMCCLMYDPRRTGTVYMPISAGITMTYNIAVAVACKLRGVPVMFHHHSYSYINRRSRLMATLNSCLDSKDCQVFLSPSMQIAFDKVYTRKSQAIAIPNSYAMQKPVERAEKAVPSVSVLRIGHLSNLTMEKGLGAVIEAFGRLKAQGYNCELHLAGPVVDTPAEETIAMARQRFSDSLKVYGPVYGEQKAAFFHAIDWFWFPTEYVNEAQPIVLVEALASGVPSLAIQRGCITWLLGDAGIVVENKNQFFDAVTNDQVIASIRDNRQLARNACASRFEELRKIEHAGFNQAIEFFLRGCVESE